MVLILMLLPGLLLPAYAESSVGYTVSVTPETPLIGEEFAVLIALDGYTAEDSGILDMQVDITGIDSSVLEVVSYTSVLLAPESSAVSVNHSEANQRIRLTCFSWNNEAIAVENPEVLELVLKVKADLTEDGDITLPVTVKLTNADKENLTMTGEIPVHYTLKPVYDVDITWGDLSFTYSDGTWNPDAHRTEGAGWTVDSENGNRITLTNQGERTVQASVAYVTERTDIQGSFDKKTMALESGATDSAVLTLSGKPSEELQKAVIGAVTITLE